MIMCMYRLRYDLEEKILEKSIRTEIMMTEYMERMEKALEKMTAYTEAYEDASKKLEETKLSVQRETTERLAVMAQNITEFQSQAIEKMASYKEVFENTKKTLEETKVALQRETTERLAAISQNITELQSQAIVPTVSFNVRKAKDLTPAWHQVITFEHVIQNNGRAYDEVTGVFTSPYDGTYLFSVKVCAKNSDFGNFNLVVDDKNNDILVVTDYEKDSSRTSSSGTVIHRLAKGQEVWVMNYYRSPQLYEGDHLCSNQFSGVLIHK